MNKILVLSTQILALLLFLNCSKQRICNKMPKGVYSGAFTKADGTILYDPNIQITEITESFMIINGSNISNNKCSIEGTIQNMSLIYQGGPVSIKGKVDKSKGKYIIKGTFNTTQGPQAFPISGNFEFKSN
jgi:hypothetical protein